MITKTRSEDYYVIGKMNLKTSKKERVKSKIKDKRTAWLEMQKISEKLKAPLSKSGYITHKGYVYGVEISSKELDKALGIL
jgi:hypothetical protein